jgi:hypothetical protein
MSESTGTMMRGPDGRLYLVRDDGVEHVEASRPAIYMPGPSRHGTRAPDVTGDVAWFVAPWRSPRSGDAVAVVDIIPAAVAKTLV